MKILVATNNKNKLKEFRKLLTGFEILSLSDINDDYIVEETGKTLKENAFLKADYFSKKYNFPVISDDSGLFVEALDGAPGVYSSRYAGLDGDYQNNRNKLLSDLSGNENRKAAFKCVICLIDYDGKPLYFTGEVKGSITYKEIGDDNFGYDPIFYSDELKKTFGEASLEEKNIVSHRGRAISKLLVHLNDKSYMENYALYISEKVLKSKNVKIVKRLLGGMSNYTYLINSDCELYTVRIPGEYADYFVDRNDELKSLKIFESLSLTNETVYFDIKSEIKISKFVDGISMNETDERHYEEVANLLKQIHTSQIKCDNDYGFFDRLKKYENYLVSLNYELPEEYLQVRDDFLRYKDYLNSLPKVLCHNDSQPSNFIFNNHFNNDNCKNNSNDNCHLNLCIVDFEFVGNNDYLYDIACFGNMDFNDALTLLKYYEFELTDEIYLRLYLWRTYQCLQWFNVAMFKELKDLSKTLKIDFLYVSKMYLENAKKLMEVVNSNPYAFESLNKSKKQN